MTLNRNITTPTAFVKFELYTAHRQTLNVARLIDPDRDALRCYRSERSIILYLCEIYVHTHATSYDPVAEAAKQAAVCCEYS